MPGRGGGRNKSGSSGRPPPSREETISKAMSYVLRHGAEKEKLKLDEGGYINCEALLNWHRLRSLRVTFPEMQHIVDTNAKKRFALIPAPTSTDPNSTKPSDFLIRASQGHSLAIASENLLNPLLPDDPACPKEVVHGTDEQSWRAIHKSMGLKRMGRQHVHFALGMPKGKGAAAGGPSGGFVPTTTGTVSDGAGAQDVSALTLREDAEEGKEQVISGMRASANILVWVDVKRSAVEGGLKWWRSANGVVLTEGDGEGVVGLEWVTRVERRETGEVIFTGERPELGE
ncbi:MAG: hypothetical protein Q9182_003111 [Xanthomendoza sp. 2 TL-2023]